MKKNDPEPNSIQQFKLGDGFQETFVAWKAKVEQEGRGTLSITHQEIVQDKAFLVIAWRIVARPHTSRR